MLKQATTLLVLNLLFTLHGCAELKDVSRTIGHTTRDVTKTIGHASRDAVHSVKEELDKGEWSE